MALMCLLGLLVEGEVEWAPFGFLKKEIEPLWRVKATANLQGFFHEGHCTCLHLSFNK